MLPLAPLPLERVLQDIKGAITAKLYYPALLVTLTVPEICAALALDRGAFVREKNYVAFVDQYTTPPELGLSGMDCFRLRGGVVHRADFRGHPHFGATHVIFTTPESERTLHGFSILAGEKTAAMFDLRLFCGAMDLAARRWAEDHKNDPKVAENLKNLISSRPSGVPPFTEGFMVVASGE
ncbi:hypothetical protein [Mesorhizobium sp.]|uniref:hypothetical protein n=1 Tax=Mesorhizobium sp. TaxID=1871066 RepID=UPI000FE30004|nr:hypothetical protein [Mesorhizobium sp.]RWQ16106.1 MAG: hypothetical protein EOR92_22795 [Mesorhizobium sp.]